VRALITGGGGQLASDLEARVGEAGVAFSHAALDITDYESVTERFREVDPDVVLNCAAFHNLDQCEADPRQAWGINVEAVRDLALRGVKLVHFSTNYVFDGTQPLPYQENDLPAPRSIYALTKLAGEHAAIAYGANALVVRTSGLYGMHGSASKGGNFVDRMIARGREQGKLSVVADQRLQPTFTADLADAVLAAVALGISGTVHLTAEGACSWHEFTVAITELAGLDIEVEPAVTRPPPGSPDRPLNGVLGRDRADSVGLPRLRPWREALEEYIGLRQSSAPT
jgi:dTDP-4-dehydrorhamnose reductase